MNYEKLKIMSYPTFFNCIEVESFFSRDILVNTNKFSFFLVLFWPNIIIAVYIITTVYNYCNSYHRWVS